MAGFEKRSMEIWKAAAERLINNVLIVDEAQRLNFRLEPEVVKQAVAEAVASRYGDTNKLVLALAGTGHTLREFMDEIAESYLIESRQRSKLYDVPPATPERIERYYREHQNEFKIEEAAEISLIALTNAPSGPKSEIERKRRLADEIRSRIVAGGDFAAFAKVYSEGSNHQNGGNLGWLTRKILRKELVDVVFALKPGETSQVVETSDGFYLLRVSGRRSSAFKPLSEAESEIRKTLEAQDRSTVIERWLSSLRKSAVIVLAPFLAGGSTP